MKYSPAASPATSTCARDFDPQGYSFGPPNIFDLEFSTVNLSWAPERFPGSESRRGGVDAPAAGGRAVVGPVVAAIVPGRVADVVDPDPVPLVRCTFAPGRRCHSAPPWPFRRDLHTNLATIAVNFCQNDSVIHG